MFFKILFCFFILILVGCDNKIDKNEDKLDDNTQAVYENANSNFELNLLNDEKFYINFIDGKMEFKNNNKAVLFVFFTTWCEPCKVQISILNNLATKYENKLKIIGILLEDKSKEQLDEFVKKYNIKYDIASGESNYLLVKSLGGVNAIPTIFLYNSNARLFNEYLGIIPQEMLDIELQKVY